MIFTIPAMVASILKIMVLLGLALYSIFAVIMVRQSQLMDKVIDETFEPVLRIVVWIHLLFALGLLGFAFIAL